VRKCKGGRDGRDAPICGDKGSSDSIGG
jgi:hypothetical protein